jgi:hypothetical protein
MTFVLGLYFLYYFTKKNRLEKDFKNKKDSIRKEMIRSDSIKSKMKRDTVQYLD